MPLFHDQLHRAVEIPFPPRRIISLVPSQTELLYDLGVAGRLVGCTKFCVHPAGLKTKLTIIGGTKQVNMEAVDQLQPDLIIANKEENLREDIELLMQHYPVWISDIKNYQDALEMIGKISAITDCRQKGDELINRIKHQFNKLQPVQNQLSAVYLIWRKPYMAAGTDTYITDMMLQCGFVNILNKARYPVVTAGVLQQLNPDTVLLSSEPYPFGEKHIAELQTILPNAQIILVDGEMFSWYGSRLQYVPEYFKQLQQQVAGLK